MSNPLFSNVVIDISGPQGNAYCILGTIYQVLHNAGYSKEEIDKIQKDMTSSNYEHLVDVAAKYITIKNRDWY